MALYYRRLRSAGFRLQAEAVTSLSIPNSFSLFYLRIKDSYRSHISLVNPISFKPYIGILCVSQLTFCYYYQRHRNSFKLRHREGLQGKNGMSESCWEELFYDCSGIEDGLGQSWTTMASFNSVAPRLEMSFLIFV